VTSPDLDALRRAGRVASQARALGAARIGAGERLSAVRATVEREIQRLGGALAFPVQIAVNEVAAHFCPADADGDTLRDGDLAKLDLGVHVDGWVVDTAVTVNVGGRAEQQRLVEAAERALAAALASARPGARIPQISATIEAALGTFGLRAVDSLCGHGVGRWTVHCPPAVPNRPEGDPRAQLAPGTTVAVEVFVTDGDGAVEERGPARIHRLDPGAITGTIDPEVVSALREFRGLPFAAHQLPKLDAGRLSAALTSLVEVGLLRSYRPLVAPSGRPIAQAEHTLYVGHERIEVLTL
jgi:methionyl aminopeptidase